MIIKKGTEFIITTGEYSDYEIVTLCVANEDLNLAELAREYFALYPEQARTNDWEAGKFISWLISIKRLMKEIDYQEFHVDAYHFEESIFRLVKGEDEEGYSWDNIAPKKMSYAEKVFMGINDSEA